MPNQNDQPVQVGKTETPAESLPKQGANRKNNKQQATQKKHTPDH